MLRVRYFLSLTLSVGVSALIFAQTSQPEKIDLNVVHRIKVAEFGDGGGAGGRGGGPSRVMNSLWNLTDRYGPRLTNSPQFRAAGDWTVGQLKEWGLSNVKLEKFATADVPSGAIPGWTLTSYSGAMTEPTYMPIEGIPVAWTPGTNGPLVAEAMLAPIEGPADLERYKGKVKGKIVLTVQPPPLAFPSAPLGTRLSAEQLANLATEVIPGAGGGGRGGTAAAALANMTPQERTAYQEKVRTFWKDEGAVLTIQASARGESGTLFGGGAPRRDLTKNLPQVSITAEQYNRIARLLQRNVPVKLSFDIKSETTTDTESFNIVAEIPGTTKPQEVVMVGAHFDSWHYGTGATDNAAGSAVAMEAMRILKSLNLKMDRTVRMALWGGEEQGLLGSAAYVKAHFADPTVMKPTAEHENLSCYFNLDNGTGKIRGIYLQGNEMMRPVFETWFAALKDLTTGVVTIRNTGGTDHQSFDRVGLPGFQFIQDPLDYNTRTHHSNMDVYDRIQAEDLQQAAVIEAIFIYHAATRPDKFPRKDLPAARPAAGEGRGGGRGGQ